MKGHIRERSPGHWAIVIDVRDPQIGQRIIRQRWKNDEHQTADLDQARN